MTEVRRVLSITMVMLLFGLSSSSILLQNPTLELDFHLDTSEPGFFEDMNSSSGQNPCPPGMWQNQSNQTTCMDADIGNYVQQWGSIASFDTGYGSGCLIPDTPQLTYENNSLYCWGVNSYGKQGYGSSQPSTTPVGVLLPSGQVAVSVSVGEWAVCAVLDEGSVYCSGLNWHGQLGDGSNRSEYMGTENGPVWLSNDSNVPVRALIPNGSNALSVSMGTTHACAVLENGSVYCWGMNNFGELGDASINQSNIPVRALLPNGSMANHVSVGSSNLGHSCAVLENGSIYCWGNNYNGQLGDGSTNHSNIPVRVLLPNGSNASTVSTGIGFTCALLENDSVYCWGANHHGQLGIGTFASNAVAPVQVELPTGSNTNSIFAGSDYTCALVNNVSVYCWGNNNYGQLGDGSPIGGSNIPVRVLLPDNMWATSISVGNVNTCAILNNDTVYCWGSGLHTHFSDFTGIPIKQITQTPCEPGTWQNMTGQTSCMPSSIGHYVPSNGSSSDTPCAPGTWQNMTGQTSCMSSSAGYYVPFNGSYFQTPCPSGTYNPINGSNSSNDCFDVPIGTYSVPGSSSPIACVIGTWQELTGQNTCMLSTIGHYVPSNGSSTDTPCAPGTWQNMTGQTSCMPSSIGHYVPSNGSSSDTPCAPGTW